MKVVNKLSIVLSVSVALGMTGCNVENLFAGPGVGGTGPIDPPIMTTSDIYLTASISKKNSPDSKPPIDNSGNKPDTIFKIQTVHKSSHNQYCQGFQKNISLVEDGKLVNQLNQKSSKVINIQVEVMNLFENNINEIQKNCTVFDVKNSNNNSILEPIAECTQPEVVIQYLPKQTHTYNVQLSNLDAIGQYKVSFLNEVEGMQNMCPTFIELLVE